MNALYIVTTYVVLDDTLKAMGYRDDCRRDLSNAEILTVAVVAARFFQNHHERALQVLIQTHAIPRFSLSRFNRRLHQAQHLLEAITEWLSAQVAQAGVAIIDTFPIPVCHIVRKKRCQKVQGPAFRGWCAAKKEWFYGFRLHWVCDAQGCPVSFCLLPATTHELTLVQDLCASLAPHTCIAADGAYVSAEQQALAWNTAQIYLIARHHSNMSPNSPEELRFLELTRWMIETAHSQLEKMGVQRLHARTLVGFSLKLLASLLALVFNHLI